MKKANGTFALNASDLVGHLNCAHLSELDRAVTEGKLAKPFGHDPLLEILAERGLRHEQNYVHHLKALGLDVVTVDGAGIEAPAVDETLAAMKRGTPIIVQAALRHEEWGGRADILRRVEIPSALGGWSY